MTDAGHERRIVKLTDGIRESREEWKRLLALRDEAVTQAHAEGGFSITRLSLLCETSTKNVYQAIARTKARGSSTQPGQHSLTARRGSSG